MRHLTAALAACSLLVTTVAPAAVTPAAPATSSTKPQPRGGAMRRGLQQPDGVEVDPKLADLRARALEDDTAYGIVEAITTEVGPRMDASEAEARARTWAVEELKTLGFGNVHVESFELPAWERGSESAAVVSPFPQPLRIVGLGNSGATPPQGLTLPVTYFQSFNDLQLAPAGSLTGRIAFVSNAMQATQNGSSYGDEGKARFIGPGIAAKKGAAAIVIRSIGTDHSRAPHTGMTLFPPDVTPIPAAALSVADAENLERMFKRQGAITLHLVLDDHAVGQRTSGNVVADVPGSDPNAGLILIGGHLDSWDQGTGAIDDAAGIAITAAAAKLLKDSGPHRRTIRVVWFGDEETGGHGGIAYAKAHGGEHVALAAESDFGADRVWQFTLTLPDGAKAVGDRLAVALQPLGIGRGTGAVYGGTDVEPSIDAGALGIDLNQSGIRYFDYHHTPEDTLDRIDPQQLKQNVAAWATMLAVMADAPEDYNPVKKTKK